MRWGERLAEATGSEGRVTLTARNWMRPVTWPLARSRPHLTGSWEGGCNLILVRKGRPGAEVVDHRTATLARLPERRVVSMVTTGAGLCVANLHASTGKGAAADLLEAAETAVETSTSGRARRTCSAGWRVSSLFLPRPSRERLTTCLFGVPRCWIRAEAGHQNGGTYPIRRRA